MTEDLGRLEVRPKTGREQFHYGDKKLNYDVLSFWQWSASDLVSNVTRGVLAEYIVAQALGDVMGEVRNEWEAYDLETSDGIKIEVKSAAYVQSWRQERLSKIQFQVGKKQVNGNNLDLRRPADVYVFALLAHTDKRTIDPLDLAQWKFFVLPTEVLNRRQRSQHSITLKSLEKISDGAVSYAGLRDAVRKAYQENLEMQR